MVDLEHGGGGGILKLIFETDEFTFTLAIFKKFPIWETPEIIQIDGLFSLF